MASRQRGFTLAEMVVGIAITSLVAVTVASTAAALSEAQSNGEENFRSLQTARITMRKIVSTVRKARLVLNISNTHVLLWAEDDTDTDSVNLLEMRLLVWQQGAGQIREYRIVPPAGTEDSLVGLINGAVPLDVTVTNPDVLITWLRNHFWASSQVLAEGVSDFEVTPESGVEATSNLLKIKITSGSGDTAVTLRSAVKIRADVSDRVANVDGTWVLVDDSAAGG